MRALEELLHPEPAWPLLQAWAQESPRSVEFLPPLNGPDTLSALQVTTRSPLGSLAYFSGGLLLDHGWVRVLGAGAERLTRDLSTWNRERLPGAILVADDASGGFFAINGGGLPGAAGSMLHLAPDTGSWQDLGLGHTQWMQWLLGGNTEQFYRDLRWPGWESETEALTADQAFSFYPFLWAQGPPLSERSRRAVPIEELWGLLG